MMATRPLSPGPAGERFGALLRQLRHAAGLDQQALSAKLTELGHPIPVGSISRMETGARRADVSDLMALAVALDVSPSRLLLPAEGDPRDPVALTETYTTSWERAWLWAAGEVPLIDKDYKPWIEQNAPHKFMPNVLRIVRESMGRHAEDLAALWQTMEKFQDRVPPELLYHFLYVLANEQRLRSIGTSMLDERFVERRPVNEC